MKNVVIVILAASFIVTNYENVLLDHELETQAQRYETRLELQEQKYKDEIIDLKQKLYGKSFELDMATNHIELLNADH